MTTTLDVSRPRWFTASGSAVISPRLDERWRAYSDAHVRIDHPDVGTLEVQPDPSGRTSGTFPEAQDRTIHIMTAHNPGRSFDKLTNDDRQRRLVARLAKVPNVTVWPAVGGDPTWEHTEESVAVSGLTDSEALELAQDFDQEAIFVWTATSWTVRSATSDRRQTTGWRLVHAAPRSAADGGL